MFHENDVPEHINELEKIADSCGIRMTNIDIWKQAKDNEKPPHLGNLYLNLLFNKLTEKISEYNPNIEVGYLINGIDSNFYINQENITSFKQFELLRSQLMTQRFVNFNPFERGFHSFKIERLAMIYTNDLPWSLHYAPIHPSQNSIKDFEFENLEAVFDDHHVSVMRWADKSRLNECRYRGQFIKIIYRVSATQYASQVIVGETLGLIEAERMIYNIQIQTGHYNRCFEINSSHLPSYDLNNLKERAAKIPSIIDAPYLLDVFLINNDSNSNFDLGIRLNRTPWIVDDTQQKVLSNDLTDLKESYLDDGFSPEFINLILFAGQADVRLIIFRDNAPILPKLATY